MGVLLQECAAFYKKKNIVRRVLALRWRRDSQFVRSAVLIFNEDVF